MKRQGNIYPKICEPENIKLAILYASRGKKKRKNVLKVLENIDMAVLKIHEILTNGNYKPSPYQEKVIHDGVRKKERIIYKPCFFPDQIIHWCLMLQIELILEKGMYDFCCASVKNRGIHYGAKHIKKILMDDRKNTKYCLKLDIKKFYPSIDKEILKRKFRKKIKCRNTLDLIDAIIDSSTNGLPIRKLYFSMVCKFLFTRFGPLHKGTITCKALCEIYG